VALLYAPNDDEYLVDFPALDIVIPWIQRHCVIPDGFKAGQPFILPPWQLWFFSNFYRVKENAKLEDDYGNPVPALGAPAFYYRRAQVILPQKIGKGPMTAAHICLEAVGPAMFAGWSDGGDVYRCRDHGCGCGWTYRYAPGEPMGTPWPTPLIQVTAFSEEQTDNVYGALKPMIEKGPLGSLMRVTEGFTRLPGGGRIDTVTSSAQSRLGQRVTFVPQDETQLWTESNKMDKVADTQRRGAAGMQGRTCETTNAFDPSENSVAQKTWESTVTDVFKLFRQAPPKLSFGDRRERRKILEHVYAGTPWISLDSIEAEILELIDKGERGQAERFYGNRLVAGNGAWLENGFWEASAVDVEPELPFGTEVCAGFDGSDSDDWTAIRLETREGYRFTPYYEVGGELRPTIWNPAEWNGSIPRGEVHAAWSQITKRYRLRRAYCDPRDWQSEIGDWALLYGEEVFIEWATYRIEAMFQALQRSKNDYKSGRSKHDLNKDAETHAFNARKVAKPGQKFILGKPTQHQKIDVMMADTLAHEAASDLRAEGWDAEKVDSTVSVMQRGNGRGRFGYQSPQRGTTQGFGRPGVSPELRRR